MINVTKAGIFVAAASTILIATIGFATAAEAPTAMGAHATPAKGAPGKAAIEKIVHDYLVSHPEILIEMSNALDAKTAASQAEAQQDALTKMGMAALLDPKISYVSGPADAKATVVEFFDYRCVHCKNSLPAVRKVLLGGEPVRFVFIEHPILTADSLVAARAAVAARRQKDKYVPFHLALMATQGDLPEERIMDIAKQSGLDTDKLKKDMADPAVLDSVKASNALADKLLVEGTPTFIIGGKFIGGELTYDEMEKLIKEAKS
jgi:protein-disulfide isomerase